jgi:predicted kinase
MRIKFHEFIQQNLNPDNLVITCGLPGSWKTETAEEISNIMGFKILRTDIIRLEVLQNEDIFDSKVASNMDKRKLVYDEMFKRADKLTNEGIGTILDATFVTQELRHRAAGIAARNRIMFVILQTSCPQEVSINRILRRTKENYESNALTEEAYLNNKRKFQAVDLEDLKRKYPALSILHFVVNTSEDPPDAWKVIDKDTV